MINNHQVRPEVSIIVPARNEEACLRECLDSLRSQRDVCFEILVVDDGSTDRTRHIAESFSEVTVIAANPLPRGWSGKSNACLTGAKRSRGKWLLFTDADTVHAPGALASALQESHSFDVAMLSYSPGQEAVTLLEKLVMPVIFAELAKTYDMVAINDPTSPAAAANGQFILIQSEDYWMVGGHASVAGEIVEDVALAKVVKAAGLGLRFRYEGEKVRTRMYRDFQQLREGWSKNLYTLFPSTLRLAALRLAEFAAIVFSFAVCLNSLRQGVASWAAVAGIALFMLYFNFLRRIKKAHFNAFCMAFSFLGLPIFSFLLTHSFIKHNVLRSVEWKGRSYVILAIPFSAKTS